MRLLLLRHGLTDWNREGRYQGCSDVSLNEDGRRQAANTVEKVRQLQPQRAFSSDLSRAVETAKIVTGVMSIPLILDPRLREIGLGKWEGLTVKEVQEKYSEALINRNRDPLNYGAPGGETVLAVAARIRSFLHEIAALGGDETVLVFSHGVALAVLEALVQRRPLAKVMDRIPNNLELREVILSDCFNNNDESEAVVSSGKGAN